MRRRELVFSHGEQEAKLVVCLEMKSNEAEVRIWEVGRELPEPFVVEAD
jgi:hypothetical protein